MNNGIMDPFWVDVYCAICGWLGVLVAVSLGLSSIPRKRLVGYSLFTGVLSNLPAFFATIDSTAIVLILGPISCLILALAGRGLRVVILWAVHWQKGRREHHAD